MCGSRLPNAVLQRPQSTPLWVPSCPCLWSVCHLLAQPFPQVQSVLPQISQAPPCAARISSRSLVDFMPYCLRYFPETRASRRQALHERLFPCQHVFSGVYSCPRKQCVFFSIVSPIMSIPRIESEIKNYKFFSMTNFRKATQDLLGLRRTSPYP